MNENRPFFTLPIPRLLVRGAPIRLFYGLLTHKPTNKRAIKDTSLQERPMPRNAFSNGIAAIALEALIVKIMKFNRDVHDFIKFSSFANAYIIE